MTCTGATLFFWFYKPLNVETTTKLSCEASIAQVLVEAGDDAKEPYQNTPLDFAEPLAYTSTQMPFSNLGGVKERPMSRIPNDRDSQLHSFWMVLTIAIPTAAFGTFQLIAWNFSFPSYTDKMLWRYVCLGNGIVLGIGCALEAYAIIASG